MTVNSYLSSYQEILERIQKLHLSFDYLRINIASPEKIKLWAERILPTGQSIGEVTQAETIDFRTHEPEPNGLFCEAIFGPLKDWNCKCGKYIGFLLNTVCDICNVELTESRVRRYRMGYIELAYPIAHFWFFKALPNYLTLILNTIEPYLKTSDLEALLYFQVDPQKSNFFKILQEKLENTHHKEKNELQHFFLKTANTFTKTHDSQQLGAELIKTALETIEIENEIEKARMRLSSFNFSPEKISDNKLVRRIRVLESFRATKTQLNWLILTILPVLPPHLRPLLELENGQFIGADLNEIYKLIIKKNNRLFDFQTIFVPDVVFIQARKILQESVDSLIDNSRVGTEKTIQLNNRPLKSLTELLEGKQGRFRQTLLGKRVDYSARSVIVVGSTLRLNQCGLPYRIGVELFKPFLINLLLTTLLKDDLSNIKLAQLILRKNKPYVWTLLTKLYTTYSVLLNRAPTLHRFGIQGFDPILVLGQAVHLHPLVCTGFNADFDGDQMAIHLPLSSLSQLEVKTMMRSSSNILSPSNGEVILKPTQDMVIGCYYLTAMITNNKSRVQKWFATEREVIAAFYQKTLTLHTPLLLHYKIYNLQFNIFDSQLVFHNTDKNLFFLDSQIIILKKYKIYSRTHFKYYLITTIGIFISNYTVSDNILMLTDLFLETTPGRIIFSTNFKSTNV